MKWNVMVCFEQTHFSYTEEFKTFQNKADKTQSIPLICNLSNYLLKMYKLKKKKEGKYAIRMISCKNLFSHASYKYF